MKAHYEEKDMSNESRIVRVETVMDHVSYMLDRMDKRFDILDQKIDIKIDALEQRIDTKFDILEQKMDIKIDMVEQKMDGRFNRMDIKIDSNFKWVVGTMITLFVLNGALPIITKMLSTFITI